MFAKTADGNAKCLAAYGRIQEGAIVPKVNELWADVQEWLDQGNEWQPMPVDLDTPKSKKRAEIIAARKSEEEAGVTIEGIRYAGDAANRQALDEAVRFSQIAGISTFEQWKDSDAQYHANHSVEKVNEALMAIALNRGLLISKEALKMAQIQNAMTVEEVESVEW